MNPRPTASGSIGNSLRLAFGTLSAYPVPAPGQITSGVAGLAMTIAPLVTVPSLVLLVAIAWLVHSTHLPPLAAAAGFLTALALSNRALHLDGLADTVDGLSASYQPQRALEVMRRGDVGPAGVAAVALLLLLQAGCLTGLLGSPPGVVLAAVAVIASRHTLAWACRRSVRAARNQGLGATVAASVTPGQLMVSAGLMVSLAALAPVPFGVPWWHGGLVLVAAVGMGELLTRRAGSRFGGLTGDVLGAVVEAGLATGLLAACVVG